MEKKLLSIYEVRDILGNDQRQFDRMVAEMRIETSSSLSETIPIQYRYNVPCDGLAPLKKVEDQENICLKRHQERLLDQVSGIACAV
ncbi:MAG: hypothetical protein GY864_01990 [Desulfobacterales bacterium]|nr:hypothetical protein [Desulfobacterales bacterium]